MSEDVTLRVYASDLVTEIATLDQPYGIAWSRERLGEGVGQFSIPHDSPVVQANPEVLAKENLVVVRLGDTDLYPWVIRKRTRTRGDVWDPISVAGPGATILLDQALVYMRGGLAGPPSDQRKFAWMAFDYQVGDGWDEPTSLGTYLDPTHPSLVGTPAEEGANEVQRVILDPDHPPFPWGSSYPSPGGLSGTWRLVFRGQRTSAIPYNATASQVASALQGLGNVDGVTVTGSGTSGDPWLVEFDGEDVRRRQHPVMKMEHGDLRHSHGVTHVARVTSGARSVDGEGIVEDWPDDRAEWFGEYGVRQHYRRVILPHEAGYADTEAYLHVVSLDEYDVWFDGEHLGSGDELDLSIFRVDLLNSPHIIAVRAVAPTMISLIEHRGGDELGSVLYRSFTPGVFGGEGSPEPWFAYGPDAPPGVTPGFILKTLFDDAQDRGYLPPLSLGFDGEVDSTGREWSKRTELGLRVGDDTVLSAAERLRDVGTTIAMTAGLVFDAFDGVRNDRGATPDDGLDTVTVALDRAREVRIDTEDEEVNALLVRNEDSWLERHIASGDRREAFLSLGTVPSSEGAATIADELIDDLIEARATIPWALSSVQDDGPRAEVDYGVGDVIVGPYLDPRDLTGEWQEADVIVDTIAARVDEVGDVDWVHETSEAP